MGEKGWERMGGDVHSDGNDDFSSVSHDFAEELGEFVPA